MTQHHIMTLIVCFFFFSSRRRHTRCSRDWSSDVCSSDLRCAHVRTRCAADCMFHARHASNSYRDRRQASDSHQLLHATARQKSTSKRAMPEQTANTAAAMTTSSIPLRIPTEQEALYREVLTVLEDQQIPYAVAGAFALQM